VHTDLDVLGAIFREEGNEWLLGGNIEEVIEPF